LRLGEWTILGIETMYRREGKEEQTGGTERVMMTVDWHGRRVWAAYTYLISVTDMYGAQHLSQHLHWTQRAARREAEVWATSLCNGKIQWQVLGDDMAMGRIGDRVFVVRAILLPLEDPPPK
jgi:hypothetical protein